MGYSRSLVDDNEIFPRINEAHRVRALQKYFRDVNGVGIWYAIELFCAGICPVSIFFSTLSIAATYYLAIILLRVAKAGNDISRTFLRAALFFMMFSALGPLALGPLAAAVKAGSPIYVNCIYFYLHFQYNGWFTFAILAVMYRKFGVDEENNFGRMAFFLLSVGCVLSLFLSFLWSHPGAVFNIAGGLGAVLQLLGLGCLLYDIFKKGNRILKNWLQALAIAAFALKLLLQLCSAFPVFVALANVHRNLIIAYLHLIMLGFLTLFIFSNMMRALPPPDSYRFKLPVYTFILAFVLSEFLLIFEVVAPFLSVMMPAFAPSMFIISLAFPVSAILILRTAAMYLKKG